MQHINDVTAPEYIDIATNVENESKKFSTEMDADMDTLLKGLNSKNITVSQWNAAICQLGYTAADVRRVYGTLKQIAFELDSNINGVHDYINAIKAAIETAFENTITNAKEYADEVAQDAERNANLHAERYTDQEISELDNRRQERLDAAKTDLEATASGLARSAVEMANAYTDDLKKYTDAEIELAKEDTKRYADALVSAGWKRLIVESLPDPQNAERNCVYMVKRDVGLDDNDVYDEYFLVEVNGVLTLELMGNTELDLSQYVPIGSANDEPSAHTYYGLKNEINDVRSSINNVLTDIISTGTIAVPPEAGNTANIVSVGCRYLPAYEISPKKFSLFYVNGEYQKSVTIDGVTISWGASGFKHRILIKGQCDPPAAPGFIETSSVPLYGGVVGVATKFGLHNPSHGQGAPDLPPVYVSVGDNGVTSVMQMPAAKTYTHSVTIQSIFIRLQRGVYYDNSFEIYIYNMRGHSQYQDTLDKLTSIDSFDENGRIIASRQVNVPHACNMYSMPNALEACDKFLFLDKTAFVLKECEKYVFTGDEPWQSDVEGIYYCRLTDILNFPKPFKAVDGDRKFNSTLTNDILTIDCTGSPVFKTVDDLKDQLRQMYDLERPYTCIVALQDPYIAEEVDFEVGSLRVKSGGTIVPNPTGKDVPVEVTVSSGSGDLAQIAYAHSQIVGNPHKTTAADVGAYSKEESDEASEILRQEIVAARNEHEYDLVVRTQEDFEKCVYSLYKNQWEHNSAKDASAVVGDDSYFNEPDPNFTAKRVLVKGVTFTKQLGRNGVQLHIFQPSIEYIKFEDCTWNTKWVISGENPRDPLASNYNLNGAVGSSSEFKRATKPLHLTVDGICISESNITSKPGSYAIGLRNVKCLKNSNITYPNIYKTTSGGSRPFGFSCQFFDSVINCSVVELWDGENVLNCKIDRYAKRCKNLVNIGAVPIYDFAQIVLTYPSLENCTNIVNQSSNFRLSESSLGYAPLEGGKIPAQYLPFYLDDVVYGLYSPPNKFQVRGWEDYAGLEEIDDDGYIKNPRKGVIYVSVEDDGKKYVSYQWDGFGFIEMHQGIQMEGGSNYGFVFREGDSFYCYEGSLLPIEKMQGELEGKVMQFKEGDWQPVDPPSSSSSSSNLTGIVVGSFNSSGTDFYPAAGYNVPTYEWGAVIGDSDTFYFDTNSSNGDYSGQGGIFRYVYGQGFVPLSNYVSK